MARNRYLESRGRKMREIKFRCWDTENKEMLRVQELDFKDTFYGGNLSIRTDQYNDYFDMEDMILMQYTGLKDRNMKEIYEGDIVKRTLRKEDGRIYFEDFYVIIFEKGAFQYKGIKEYYISETGVKYSKKEKGLYRQDLGSNFGVDIEDIEVIGNIYDNLELLEEGE